MELFNPICVLMLSVPLLLLHYHAESDVVAVKQTLRHVLTSARRQTASFTVADVRVSWGPFVANGHKGQRGELWGRQEQPYH